MTHLLENLVTAVRTSPVWAARVPHTPSSVDAVTCQDWGRKGGSHYKDGQFDKK
jgi:hypothetical protein